MFVFTTKLNPVKLLAAGAAFVALAAGILYAVLPHGESDPGAAEAAETASRLKVADAEDVRTFLQSYGWETSASGKEEKVVIPSDWNATFENYNVVQKAQGFDLGRYKGKEMTRYTFEITNYPDQNETVLANVLVYRGKVAGGDVSTARADGYMHGFSPPEGSSFAEPDTAADALPSSEAASESESETIPEK